MDGAPLPGCNALGVGPLAIGDVKYKTEGLFKRMIAGPEPSSYDFRDAFQLAQSPSRLDEASTRCSPR